MLISLSILEYEPELSENIDNLENTKAYSNIMKLIQTGKVHRIHIDVMRPPMIPNKSKFSIPLIRRLYEKLHNKIALTIHLMVDNPFSIIEEINKFIADEDKANVTIIVQVESFSSEDEAVKAIETIKSYGYNIGVSLNLPTPKEKLTDKIASLSNVILLMTVPMGSGGQKYHKNATQRIKYFSMKFPDKIIKVDGGINPETIVEVWMAGARAAVIGSYITASNDPEKALLNIEHSLKSFTGT
jgi:ribulose-phosphate 3-epimerase